MSETFQANYPAAESYAGNISEDAGVAEDIFNRMNTLFSDMTSEAWKSQPAQEVYNDYVTNYQNIFPTKVAEIKQYATETVKALESMQSTDVEEANKLKEQ